MDPWYKLTAPFPSAPAAEWTKVLERTAAQAPEAFAADHALLNLFEGGW
jgi:hypothetical protein